MDIPSFVFLDRVRDILEFQCDSTGRNPLSSARYISSYVLNIFLLPIIRKRERERERERY